MPIGGGFSSGGGGGGASAAWQSPGVEIAAFAEGAVPTPGEVCVVVAGDDALSIASLWLVNLGTLISANNTNGVSFTVNTRSADAQTLVATAFTSTGTTGEGGLGDIDSFQVATYTFAEPLEVPAGGSATIQFDLFGIGRAMPAFKIGVHLA